MLTYRLLLGFCSLLLLVSSTRAQTSEVQFDLVIFGSNLDADNTEVWLRENPGSNNNWQRLDSGQIVLLENDQFSSMVFRNLPSEQFAGQDIRENYIAMKITGAENSEVRAVYALPSTERPLNEVGSKLHSAIKSHPQTIRKYSIASQIRPRPVSLSENSAFVEYIEMPVRHLKPGIQEVKWLDIIFSS